MTLHANFMNKTENNAAASSIMDGLTWSLLKETEA